MMSFWQRADFIISCITVKGNMSKRQNSRMAVAFFAFCRNMQRKNKVLSF